MGCQHDVFCVGYWVVNMSDISSYVANAVLLYMPYTKKTGLEITD